MSLRTILLPLFHEALDDRACYVMMFVSYCIFHNICILLDVFFEFQIAADLLCLAAY